jgi:hypothetical protein
MARVWIAALAAAVIVATTASLAPGAQGVEPPDALFELIREGKAAG